MVRDAGCGRRGWQIVGVDSLCDELTAEHDALDLIVAEADLSVATPAPGWTVGDQISHLWVFDQRAMLALTDPDAFRLDAQQITASGPDASSASGRAMSSDELL